MSGGNQQKAIIAREMDKDPELLIAVQPTRGLDVGAIEYIHAQLIEERDKGKAVLLVSLELEEVMNVSDRILVMYEGEIVGELDPKNTTSEELGLYMAGAKRGGRRLMSMKKKSIFWKATPCPVDPGCAPLHHFRPADRLPGPSGHQSAGRGKASWPSLRTS